MIYLYFRECDECGEAIACTAEKAIEIDSGLITMRCEEHQ